MKKITLLILTLALSLTATYAQVAINTDGTPPDSSAILDVQSTTRGMLIPRLTTAQRNTLTHLSPGLIIYDTDVKSFFYYNGTSWFQLNAFTDGGNRTDLGFELGTTFGSLSIQGEYKTQKIDASGVDYKMNSYYAFASYFITGEHRPYKHAAFGRVKPKKDIDNGGFGALEVLARYSNMNASQDVVLANAGLPKDVNNISLGINWYLNAHTKMMYGVFVCMSVCGCLCVCVSTGLGNIDSWKHISVYNILCMDS